MNDISKSDWQLFNKLLPKWQERYMNRLNQEYKRILDGDGSAANKFWKLEKQLKADRKSPGVLVEEGPSAYKEGPVPVKLAAPRKARCL